jgi:very-short-patch-repair endonuclease
MVNVQKLVQFYLACIETEDRQALSKKLSALHHSVISPWDREEELFRNGAVSAEFELSDASDKALLARGAAIAGDAERFYYGYPLFLFLDRDEWALSPLFMQEVKVTLLNETRGTVQVEDPGGLEVNLHLFQKQRVPPEELKSLARELEGDFPTFDARLESAFQTLGVSNPGFDQKRLDPWPAAPLKDGSWHNRPILFKSERSPYTIHLRKELEILSQDPSVPLRLGGTALGPFFGTEKNPPSEGQSPVPLIQVLPMNQSQEDAAKSALKEPLTVVTGPPGTGKSQVVVNLLASCALAGKPVLFASKNNKAVEVVRQRLRDLLGDQQDWVLRLGNREMMESCRQEMDGRLAAVPNLTPETAVSVATVNQLDAEIESTRKNIAKLSNIQGELSTLDLECRSLEGAVPEEWVEACKSLVGDCTWLSTARETWRTSQTLASPMEKGIGLWVRRTLLRKKTLGKLSMRLDAIIAELPEGIRSALAQSPRNDFGPFAHTFKILCALGEWRQTVMAYERTFESLKRQPTARSLVTQLEDFQTKRSEMAALQFRIGWTNRVKASPTHHRLSKYFDLANRASRNSSAVSLLLKEWALQVAIVGADLPVWIVTSLSARRALPLSPSLFDLVIVDEASQCDIPSALPILYRARRALIIGDPQQLRHISTLRTSDETELATEYGLADSISKWSYNNRSFYNLAEEVSTEAGNRIGFLAEHYRSHPEIVEFSNKAFYQGRLVLRTRIDLLRDRMGSTQLGVIWHDTPGVVPQSARSAWNSAEIEGVLTLLGQWNENGFLEKPNLTFGVVTPFRLQMEKMRDRIARAPWYNEVSKRLTVGTAHRFQGDECDVMIFSPVVARGMSPTLVRWVAGTDQLLNVAITRARAALHVVGDMSAILEAGGRLGDFAATVQAGIVTTSGEQQTETPSEQVVADILRELGIWHKTQYPIGRYRLDFLAVSPMGVRYDLEVDGRGHLTDEAVRSDEIRDAAVQREGLKVLRIDARDVFRLPETVKAKLERL